MNKNTPPTSRHCCFIFCWLDTFQKNPVVLSINTPWIYHLFNLNWNEDQWTFFPLKQTSGHYIWVAMTENSTKKICIHNPTYRVHKNHERIQNGTRLYFISRYWYKKKSNRTISGQETRQAGYFSHSVADLTRKEISQK